VRRKVPDGDCQSRGRQRGFPQKTKSPKNESLQSSITGGADMRVKVTMACTECKQRNYNTKKNKKNDPDRLEMNKFCKFCKKHTLHRETK
jgi:large subunit ribosomal protein L33